MGWKGGLRSLNASMNRWAKEAERKQREVEREARRRQREFEARRKELRKMRELDRAAFEVEEYENYIDLFQSVHKECNENWDWQAVRSSEPPVKPAKENRHEKKAQARLNRFKPSVMDKLRGLTETKRNQLARAVENGMRADDREYEEAMREYEERHSEWIAMRQLAEAVLMGDIEAYLYSLETIDPFKEIQQLGSSVSYRIPYPSLVEATLLVKGEEVIPSEKKTLTKTGKLSVKNMPKSRFNEFYQDYVCGCALRVGREIFALLPTKTVIVNTKADVLDTKTGRMREAIILSVVMERETLEKLNFQYLDPSDSMANFSHHMNFKKSKGFSPVEPLEPLIF